MPLPTLADGTIDQDSPFSETVAGALKARDDYNYDGSTNGGSGIAPQVIGFGLAMIGHSHDGTDGAGENIDSPGIASGAASAGDMFQALSVTTAKIATNTMTASELDDGAVTKEKMAGSMSNGNFSGSSLFDTEDSPLPGDQLFKGDTAAIGHSKGRPGVVVNIKAAPSGFVEFFVRKVDSTHVYLGIRYKKIFDALAITSGTWHWEFDLM
jgi:hypothetical protein